MQTPVKDEMYNISTTLRWLLYAGYIISPPVRGHRERPAGGGVRCPPPVDRTRPLRWGRDLASISGIAILACAMW